jgi:hypothetical protein
VGAGKEYLLNVGIWPGHIVHVVFVVISGQRSSSFSGRGCSAVEERDEFDTVLVEGQRVAEVHDGVVRSGKGQVPWYQSDRLHGG